MARAVSNNGGLITYDDGTQVRVPAGTFAPVGTGLGASNIVAPSIRSTGMFGTGLGENVGGTDPLTALRMALTTRTRGGQ